MAKYWSVSDEDVEFTKHCIRHFILAKRLSVKPTIDPQDMDKLNDIWEAYARDDITHDEYRQLWREVEREIAK